MFLDFFVSFPANLCKYYFEFLIKPTINLTIIWFDSKPQKIVS